jgi:hypothetical protein
MSRNPRMKNLPYLIMGITLILIFPVFADARIIVQDNFDGYSDIGGMSDWDPASNISLQETGGINNSKCALVTYDRSGTPPYWFGRSVANENLSQMYVRFYFKVDDPSGGCKFLKLFGKRNGLNYANSTFAIHYNSSLLYEISYGNGDNIENDTQNTVRYDGTVNDPGVIIERATGAFDPRDGQWHCFEVFMKYNDNGLRNGEYRVWVDGELRLHATNVKNRHDEAHVASLVRRICRI